MEPSSQKDVSNNIRITLPPPTTLQNNNNSTLSRLDDPLNNFPIISSMSSASNNNNNNSTMFSSLLPKQSSLALNNNNNNSNRVELPSIESLGHNNLNNFIFPQRHYSATNSNNLIDSLTSNRMSVSAILSNNSSSSYSNDQFPTTSSSSSSSSSILLHPPLTRSSPVSIPSLSSLTQFLDEKRRNTDLESHNNNTNNIKDIDNSDFYHYGNKNDCHQNDDNNKVAEGDEVMEEIIINDNNEIVNKSIGNNHNKKIKKMKNKHKKIAKKEHHHHLGQLVYSPKEILPPLEFNVNSLLEVWISAKHLSWENLKVRKRFLWGTDIYTDDSDIVAVLIHTGNYIPVQYNFKSIPDYPDYDLCVTIRVCPKLSQYPKSTRNNYKSRAWGNHDGVSYKIERVEKMRHNEMIGALKREKNKNLNLQLKKSYNNTKGKKLIKESSRKSGKKTNDLVVFNKHGDPCYKYSPNLVSDSNYLKNKLRVEVMYLENDDETYEISYDEVRDKYRFAIVSSDAGSEEGYKNNNNNKVPEEGKMQDVDDNNVDDYIYDDDDDDDYDDDDDNDDDDDDNDDDKLKDCPLRPKDLYEIFRDDLEFHEISWNILGLVVADKTNYLHSLLCIIQRVFWRPKLS